MKVFRRIKIFLRGWVLRMGGFFLFLLFAHWEGSFLLADSCGQSCCLWGWAWFLATSDWKKGEGYSPGYVQGGIPFPVHYPRSEGVVYGVPHVSIIAHQVDPQVVRFYVDGRRVSESAFSHCLICAGSLPAVLVSRADWTVTDGEHILDVEFLKRGEVVYRQSLRYWVDTTVPTVRGLSGLGVFPGGFISLPESTRVGFFTDGRARKAFVGAGLGKGFPVEFAISSSRREKGGEELSFDWKVQAMGDRNWAVSFGRFGGDSFGALGWRQQPAWVEVHLGVGSGELPSWWAGVGLRLALLTRRLVRGGESSDLIAVLDLVRLNAEVDERGRPYLGVGVYHPYGWRVTLQQVPGVGKSRWVFFASYSVGFAKGAG